VIGGGPNATEFEEIAHGGGKIEFIRSEGGLSVRVSNSNAIPWGMYYIAASYNGVPLHSVPIRGIGVPFDMINPSVLVPIGSDREGLFGYSCPECSGYFRSRRAGASLVCPYCDYGGDCAHFLTTNQREFVRTYCAAYLEAHRGDQDVTINLDDIAAGLSSNTPSWIYNAERQQHRFECENCKTITDILGEYGGCPSCGQRNAAQVLREALSAIQARYEKANIELKDQRERGEEWGRLLVATVSAFEGMANDIRDSLLRLPYTPKRRHQLRELSFQNLITTASKLKDWFAFDIFTGIDTADSDFLTRALNRRHLITHKSSVVDDEYIRNTNDTTVRLGQRIRIASNDVPRAVRLLTRVGEALAGEFASVRWPDDGAHAAKGD
jgi:DNA-directed RNA polymerase subunit RPC12/RpoP